MDELFKRGERLKIPVSSYQKPLPTETAKLFASDDPGS